MKTITKRIESTINVLKHLMYLCPEQTEIIEEQVANLELTLEVLREL